MANLVVGGVHILREAADRINVSHLSVGCVVQHPLAHPGGVLHHYQAIVGVIEIVGRPQIGCCGARLHDTDQAASSVIARRSGEAIGQGNGGLGACVVIGRGRGVDAHAIGGWRGTGYHPPKTIIGKQRNMCGIGLYGLEQLARLAVHVVGSAGLTATRTIHVGRGVGGRGFELPAEVIPHVRTLGPGQVLRRCPGLHRCFRRRVGYTQTSGVIRLLRKLNGHLALTCIVVLVFSNTALCTDVVAQLVLARNVIHIAGGHGLARSPNTRIEGLSQQLVLGIKGPSDGVAQRVNLLGLVAIAVVAEGDGVIEAVCDGLDITRCVVRIVELRQAQGIAGRDAGAHARQLPLNVIFKAGGTIQRVCNRRATIGSVVGVLGSLIQAIGDGGYPVTTAGHVDVGDVQAAAIRLADAGYTVAGTFVGVVCDVGLAVSDQTVCRAQIDRHAGQTIVVVGIANPGAGVPGLIHNTDLAQIVANVVVVGGFARGVGNTFQSTVTVVSIANGVVIEVRAKQQLGRYPAFVALFNPGAALGPHILVSHTIVSDAVVCPFTIGADVFAGGGVKPVDGLRSIAGSADDGAARGIADTA